MSAHVNREASDLVVRLKTRRARFSLRLSGNY